MDRTDALKKLLGTSPRHLVDVREDGRKPLWDLYKALAASQLVSTQYNEDDKYQLFSVFDVCLRAGYACYILDYVKEVCCDPSLTSFDPNEAYLLDGQVVHEWCQGVLADLERIIKNEFVRLKYPENIGKEMVRISRVVMVLAALEDVSAVTAAKQRATYLQQGLQVLQWSIQRDWFDQEPSASYESHEQWSTTHKRATAVQDLYLTQLIHSMDSLHAVKNYPFKSILDAIETLFFHQNPSFGEDKRKARLCMFGYFLLAAGFVPNLGFLRHPPFCVPDPEIQQLEGRFHLDVYSMSRSSDLQALRKACTRFRLSMDHVPFEIIRKLIAAGQPKYAIELWLGQGGDRQNCSLEKAKAILEARLSLDNMLDAFDGIRSHCCHVSEQEGIVHLPVLLGKLFEAALGDEERMKDLIRLPINESEEAVFLDWASSRWEEHGCGILSALYFLARSRMGEAAAVVETAEREGRMNADRPYHEQWIHVRYLVKSMAGTIPNTEPPPIPPPSIPTPIKHHSALHPDPISLSNAAPTPSSVFPIYSDTQNPPMELESLPSLSDLPPVTTQMDTEMGTPTGDSNNVHYPSVIDPSSYFSGYNDGLLSMEKRDADVGQQRVTTRVSKGLFSGKGSGKTLKGMR